MMSWFMQVGAGGGRRPFCAMQFVPGRDHQGSSKQWLAGKWAKLLLALLHK